MPTWHLAILSPWLLDKARFMEWGKAWDLSPMGPWDNSSIIGNVEVHKSKLFTTSMFGWPNIASLHVEVKLQQWRLGYILCIERIPTENLIVIQVYSDPPKKITHNYFSGIRDSTNFIRFLSFRFFLGIVILIPPWNSWNIRRPMALTTGTSALQVALCSSWARMVRARAYLEGLTWFDSLFPLREVGLEIQK